MKFNEFDLTSEYKELENIEIIINFIKGPKIEINSKKHEEELEFDVEIINLDKNDIITKYKLKSDFGISISLIYFINFKINIKYKNKLLLSHILNLNNQTVLIVIPSKALGDTLAWLPYVEKFRKINNCKIHCICDWINIFNYPNITFIPQPEKLDSINIQKELYYAKYYIGTAKDLDTIKIDYKNISLQKLASDTLGLPFEELKPILKIPKAKRTIKEKYICISQFGSSNTKNWHYPNGWQILVDWLNSKGYKVMVISKEPTTLKNIIDKTGNIPIKKRITQLKYCEFYIGVASGLSWLSWSINKNVVMISGFSNPITEFKSNNVRIHNPNVCNSCYQKYNFFEVTDFNWCPEHKNTDRQFECSKSITPKMIIDKITEANLIEDNTKIETTLNEKDINISYQNSNLIINYNGLPLILNIEIKDYFTKQIYHTINNIQLNTNLIIPINITQTENITISFFNENFTLDIDALGLCRMYGQNGWIKHIRFYDTGRKIEWSRSRPIVAVHFQKNYFGDTSWSYFEGGKKLFKTEPK